MEERVTNEGPNMDEERLIKKLEGIERPELSSATHQRQLKLVLVSAKRSSRIGILLVTLPCLFIFGVILKYGLGVASPLFSALEEKMADIDRSFFRFVPPLLLVGGPLIALGLNLLTILHFHIDRVRRELGRYSNSNYYLLGQIIEKVSGKKYEEFLYEHIFQPLEMKTTRMTDYRDMVPNRAAGYNWLGEDVEQTPAIITGFHGTKNVMQNAIYISPTRKWAAGAIASSVNDLVKWDQSLRTDKLLLQPADE